MNPITKIIIEDTPMDATNEIKEILLERLNKQREILLRLQSMETANAKES